jgi:hypothetical protein
MTPIVAITGIVALYIFMLAAFTGYEVIAKVPVILHTPLMSGSNFVHGIVLVGAMVALGGAHTTLEKSHRRGWRVAGGRQCGRRLCRHRTHAGDVQVQRHEEKGGWPLMDTSALGADAKLLGDPGQLPGHGVPVHHGPEAHELAGHGAQRHRLGRRRHAGGHAVHVPVPGTGQLRAGCCRRSSSAPRSPGGAAGAWR